MGAQDMEDQVPTQGPVDALLGSTWRVSTRAGSSSEYVPPYLSQLNH